MQTPDNRVTCLVAFRTRIEYKERIEKLAQETKRTASFYYNLLLEEYLDELEEIYLGKKQEEDEKREQIRKLREAEHAEKQENN